MTEKKRIELLLKKGEKFHCAGLVCLQIFVISFSVFITTLLVVTQFGIEYEVIEEMFLFPIIFSEVDALNFVLISSFIGTLGLEVGFILYCVGIHFMGLGQIAKNTYKGEEEIVDDDGVHYM